MIVHQGRRRELRGEARRGGPPLHARQLAAAQRRQPHRHVGRLHDHPGRAAAGQQPVPAPQRRAGRTRSSAPSPASSAWCPEGLVLLTSVAFAVGVVRLGRAALPRAGAAGDRGARPRRRAVRRQDRHHHRGHAGARRGRAARRRGPRRRSTPRSAALAQLDPDPNATSRALQNAYTRHDDVDGHRPRAVLVGPQVERDDVRRTTAAGCSARRRTCSPRRYSGRRRATRSRRHAEAGQRVLLLAKADGTFTDGADAALPTVDTDGAGVAGRHRPPRRTGDAEVLRRPGRDGEGDQRRQQRHRRRGRPTRRSGRLGGQRRRHARCFRSDGREEFADAVEQSTGVRPCHAAPEAGDGQARCSRGATSWR